MNPILLSPLIVRPIEKQGRLYGTTEMPPPAGAPGESVPAPRRYLHIFERQYPAKTRFFAGVTLIDAVRSDAAGNWHSQVALYADRAYAAVAYDPTGKYDPVVKINLIPDPL